MADARRHVRRRGTLTATRASLRRTARSACNTCPRMPGARRVHRRDNRPAFPNSAHCRIPHRRLRRRPRLAPSDTRRGAAGAWPNFQRCVGAHRIRGGKRADARCAARRAALSDTANRSWSDGRPLPGGCVRCAHRQSMVSPDRTPAISRCAGRCARPRNGRGRKLADDDLGGDHRRRYAPPPPPRLGPLSRTILDVSVVQDLTAVLLVTVVLALALPLGSRGIVRPGAATHTLLILLGSIVAGITLGLAAAQYLRAIRDHLAWVLVVLAFVVSQAVRLIGLDAVLIALAAGCTLRYVVPEQNERVRAELKRCAIPVYVVFFALAGSNLQLEALGDLWQWALLLVGLRAVGLWGGVRWAGRSPTVGADWVNHGWLGFVSQGGLAVTLAAVLRRAFPEWNVSLEALLVAMIGVDQLAGPICFQWVLRRTGEVTGEAHAGETPGTAG